jgi:hypothetical protein
MSTSFPRRWLQAGSLALAIGLSASAWALPTPKDIEAAVQAGHLTQAETMLREVLHDKPGSAKAHYELGQVLAREGQYTQARDQLLEAKRLDPTLKFASSATQFDGVLEAVTQHVHAVRPTPVASAAAHPNELPAAQSGMGWMPLALLGVGGLFLVGWWLRRSSAAARTPGFGGALQPQSAGGGFGSGGTAGPPYGGGGYVPPAAPGMGSSVAGAVVGGLAGVAAGYALSRALDGGHDAMGTSPPHAADRTDPGYISFDNTASADTAGLGAFDAGSGNGWDDGGSTDPGSSGSDDW